MHKSSLKTLGHEGWNSPVSDTVKYGHFHKGDSNELSSMQKSPVPFDYIQHPFKTEDLATTGDVKVCRICFASDCKLFPMTSYKNLDQAYEILTGLTIKNDDKLPQYLCTECCHCLLKCIGFRNRSIQANVILQKILQERHNLSIEAIKTCSGYRLLNSKLSVTHKQNNHYDLDIKHVETENIRVAEQGHGKDKTGFSVVQDIKIETDEMIHQNTHQYEIDLYEPAYPLRMHEVIVPGIKIEKDDDIIEKDNSQDNIKHEDVSDDYNDIFSNSQDTMIKIEAETIEMTNQDTCIANYGGNHGDIGEDCASNKLLTKRRPETGHGIYTDVITKNTLQIKKDRSQKFDIDGRQKMLNGLKGSNIHELRNLSDQAKTHFKPHSKKKEYICDICKRGFSRRYSLTNHLRIHSRVEPYSCNICHKTFNLKSTLVSHMSKHSGEKLFECNVCTKSFFVRNGLQKHMKIHTGEQPYSCDVCKKTFNRKGNLIVHIKTHSGEKPYSCNVCKKEFRHRCNLLTHYKAHSGEKPYSCEICMTSFSQSCHLKRHLKMHSSERLHKCDVCAKSFDSQSHLRQHVTIHSNLRPHSCDVCKKTFNRKGNLNVHLKTHSDEKSYVCTICNKRFRRQDRLNIHIKNHTKERFESQKIETV